MTLLGFVCGAGLAASIALLAAVLGGWQPHRAAITAPRRGDFGLGGSHGSAGLVELVLGPGFTRRAWIGLGAALLVAVVTRWPVAVVATMMVVLAWPAMFGAARSSAGQIARLEAVATWTESMRDSIAGSIALEEAIRNTADAAPEVIQEPLQRLVGSLTVHVPLPQGLAQLAEDFDDESIDLVAAALILNSRLRGPGLVATLSALATSVREELDMRRRVEEERKSLRRDARTIMATTLAFAAGLALFSRSYMAPYSTVVGQVVLSGVVVVFVLALAWIRRLSEARAHERFLVGPETLARAHGASPLTSVRTPDRAPDRASDRGPDRTARPAPVAEVAIRGSGPGGEPRWQS